MEVKNLEQPNFSNDVNYVPSFVDIEGLQGVNSAQGMNYMGNDNIDPTYGMMPISEPNMQPYGDYSSYYMEPGTNPMMGMEQMPNMGCMNPNQMYGNMNGMNMLGMDYPQSMAGIMTCIANMCYMTSVLMMQMVNGGYFNSPMGMNGGNGMMDNYNGMSPCNY